MRRLMLVVALAAAACGGGPRSSSGASPAAVPAAKVLVNVDAEGVGLGGFDPVGYRSAGKPVTGLPEHTAAYGGATFRFASDESAAAFHGAEHAPQFGGYCAYAASQGRLSQSDPLVFEIYEGQLLVFTNAEFKELFDRDPAANKAKADAAWPGLVAKYGK